MAHGTGIVLPATGAREGPRERPARGWQEETWGPPGTLSPPCTSSVMTLPLNTPCYPEGGGTLLVLSRPHAGRADNTADRGLTPGCHSAWAHHSVHALRVGWDRRLSPVTLSPLPGTPWAPCTEVTHTAPCGRPTEKAQVCSSYHFPL